MNQMQLRSEQIVLHSMLLHPSTIHETMGKVSSEMFFNPINKVIFEAAYELYLSQEPINVMSLSQCLMKKNTIFKREAISELTSIIGMTHLSNVNELQSSMYFLISENVRNEHVDLAKKIEKMSASEDYDPQNVINTLQSHITDNKFKSLIRKKDFDNESLLKALDQKMADALTKEGVSGIETGYKRFDVLTSGMQPTNFIIIAARPAMGKELINTSRVYTPNGYIHIGSAKVGDRVLGSDGSPYNVTGVFPQGKKDVYRVWFDDGTFVDSGLEHQWEVTTRAIRKRKDKTPIVVTTKDMIGNVILDGFRKNYSIRMCEPLHFKKVQVDLHPYLMGFMLGDGHLAGTSMVFSNTEQDLLNRVTELLPGDDNYVLHSGCSYGIRGGSTLNAIKKYGLHGARSHEKFIPDEYLYNSVENRIELLRGLIDTDGYCVGRNAVEYSTTSKRLCENIAELVRGLGGKCSYSEKQGSYTKDGNKIICKKYYRMYISMGPSVIPVSSNKHLAKYNSKKSYHCKFITKIEPLCTQEEMTCISVDAPDCLYVTDGYTLTHNTQYALGLMKHASIRNNHKGLFISCEMDEVQVMKRVISVDSGIPGYHIKRGRLETREIMRYEKSRKRIINSSFKIAAGSFTISDVLSMVYKMKYSEGLDYVVIDYIQKITSPGAQNRTNEVGDVSRKLKDMANELKIPVIALAQLSRAVEHRTDKKPMLSDLRESGDIEQDADIVMFLYRNGYYMSPEEKENNSSADDGYAIIAKHRDGELEDIYLKFDANIPAWKNPNEPDDPDEDYVQTSIRPNTNFDIF